MRANQVRDGGRHTRRQVAHAVMAEGHPRLVGGEDGSWRPEKDFALDSLIAVTEANVVASASGPDGV